MIGRRLADWSLVAAATVGGGLVADRVGVPSGYLFVALLVGLICAIRWPGRLKLPRGAFRVGQAVTGVALGTFLQSSTLSAVGKHWLPVLAVSAATLAVTIAAGLVLARVARLDRPTASLGMVAGGASGIVAMADELGGDDRLVAFMQYLRVLVITLLTPLIVPLAFAVHSVAGGGEGGPLLGTAAGWALTVGVATVGALVGPLLRLPAPSLLGPLIITAVLTLTGVTSGVEVPPLAREVAFGLIGLQIGLGFERGTLREIRRIAWPVALSIAGLIVISLGLGWVLSVTADESLLTGYLATTPGGLYAVLPIAFCSGADTGFVLAVQGLRLFAMVLAAPAVVRWLIRRQGTDEWRARARSYRETDESEVLRAAREQERGGLRRGRGDRKRGGARIRT
ncbi:MAG: AbrB family transcriptional regulator [Solirubrobacteraceae bacterium]